MPPKVNIPSNLEISQEERNANTKRSKNKPLDDVELILYRSYKRKIEALRKINGPKPKNSKPMVGLTMPQTLEYRELQKKYTKKTITGEERTYFNRLMQIHKKAVRINNKMKTVAVASTVERLPNPNKEVARINREIRKTIRSRQMQTSFGQITMPEKQLLPSPLAPQKDSNLRVALDLSLIVFPPSELFPERGESITRHSKNNYSSNENSKTSISPIQRSIRKR